MQEFDSIRPYGDDEVPQVLARLRGDPVLLSGVSSFMWPHLFGVSPGLARSLMRAALFMKTRNLRTVRDFQSTLSAYFERMLATSVTDFSVDGLERLSPRRSYLFVSNHRDIALDSGLLSYALYHAGHETPRIAVGDNLFSQSFAADLMRVNKSFMVERSARGTKAVYASMMRTSRYIRHSLETGHSVWIAQREGRAKDGYDRTETALIKMLGLAYRKEVGSLAGVFDRISLVPTSISYEFDPCDLRKAHALYRLDVDGEYVKPFDDDLRSMIEGIVGFKGRVQLTFGEPLRVEDSEAVADRITAQIDREIVRNIRVFATHRRAAAILAAGCAAVPGELEGDVGVERGFDQRLRDCPPQQRPYLLKQYANLMANRTELGL